jgi:oxygen-dependent protoporphyrinogen oxidase
MGVRGEPELARVIRYVRAMPQYQLGHLDRVARIEARSQAIAGFALAGNAYRGVGIPDAVRSGEAAAARLAGTRARDANELANLTASRRA